MYPVLRKCLIPIANDLSNAFNSKLNSTHFNGYCKKCTHTIAYWEKKEKECFKSEEIEFPRGICLAEEENSKFFENSFSQNGVTMEKNSRECSPNEDRQQQQQQQQHPTAEPKDSIPSPRESFQCGRIAEEIKRNLSWIRWTEYSAYAKDLIKTNKWESIQDEIISVVSYNVLSQVLLEKHRYLYRRHDERSLRWDLRSRILKEELEDFNADILCLQEVDSNLLNSFYNYNLNQLGYEGIYKQRTNDKVDGCAIYFKRDKFNLEKHLTVELFKESIHLLDRDNIGIILKLSLKSNPELEVIVATTHLLYNPRRGDIKLAQTQLILAEIEKMAYLGHNPITRQPEYLPIIFTGDMNYSPENGVYKLVTKSFLEYEGMSSEQLLPTMRGRTLNKTLLPPGVGITDSCQYASSVSNRGGNSEISFSTGTLDHYLNFESAYDHVKSNLPEATTNQDEWITVDYIFYSQLWDEKLKSRTEGNLKLLSRLTLPNSREARIYLKYIPNLACASDHLPLLAVFHVKKNR